MKNFFRWCCIVCLLATGIFLKADRCCCCVGQQGEPGERGAQGPQGLQGAAGSGTYALIIKTLPQFIILSGEPILFNGAVVKSDKIDFDPLPLIGSAKIKILEPGYYKFTWVVSVSNTSAEIPLNPVKASFGLYFEPFGGVPTLAEGSDYEIELVHRTITVKVLSIDPPGIESVGEISLKASGQVYGQYIALIKPATVPMTVTLVAVDASNITIDSGATNASILIEKLADLA